MYVDATGRTNAESLGRRSSCHCEERSDEAISIPRVGDCFAALQMRRILFFQQGSSRYQLCDVCLTQFQSGRHDLLSFRGNAAIAGATDLMNQPMGTQQAQRARHSRRGTTPFLKVRARMPLDPFPDVTIREALEMKSSLQDRRKDHRLRGTYWTQAPVRALVFPHRPAHRIQQPMGGGRYLHPRERLQITRIGGATDFHAPSQVHHAMTHPYPPQTPNPLPDRHPPDRKSAGIVDGRLDPQHRTLLVVHLDRVLLQPCRTRTPSGRTR